MTKLKPFLTKAAHGVLGVTAGAAMLVSLAATSPLLREPAVCLLRDADSTPYLADAVHLLASPSAGDGGRWLAVAHDIWSELTEAW